MHRLYASRLLASCKKKRKMQSMSNRWRTCLAVSDRGCSLRVDVARPGVAAVARASADRCGGRLHAAGGVAGAAEADLEGSGRRRPRVARRRLGSCVPVVADGRARGGVGARSRNGQGDLARRVRRAVSDESGGDVTREGTEVDAGPRSRPALHVRCQRHPVRLAGAGRPAACGGGTSRRSSRRRHPTSASRCRRSSWAIW